MSHDAFNTRGGQVGFLVETEGGKVYREDRHTWDDIPREARIKSLSIVHFPTGHAFLKMTGHARYGFSNIAAQARQGGVTVHAAKELVAGNDMRVHVIVLGFEGHLPVRHRSEEIDAKDVTLAPHAMRRGAV